MTERLSALLRDEAAALDIPPVDHAAILARGRQTPTPRRATTWLAAAAVVTVVGAGATWALQGDDDRQVDDRAIGPVAAPGPSRGVLAYGADSTVVVDGASVTVPGSLNSLHYTSVGVLARSLTITPDGAGLETLTLVTEDGTVTELGTISAGVGPATDPDEEVYAQAEKSGDGFEAVVRDARTGDAVGSIPLPDLPMSYWSVPPLGLDGDVVYAGFANETYAVNWRTGEAQPAAGLSGGIPLVRGGNVFTTGEELNEETGALDLVVSVVEAATGDVVLGLDDWKSPWIGDAASGVLSPDGRFARLEGDTAIAVHDLETRDEVGLTGESFDWGWTSGGFLFKLTGQGLEVCNPMTGTCETEPAPPVGPNLRHGGIIFESYEPGSGPGGGE